MASRVRSAGGNLFWELFAGVAILSRTFKEEGWRTGPPIDIVYTEAFNLLDPGFFMVVLGLVLEGWVSVLHDALEEGQYAASSSLATHAHLH